MLHLIMASHQDDPEAGPSGLSVQERLALLGLDTSNSEKEDALGESDEDDLCQEVLDRFERQRAFQTQLLQQSGGALDASVGAFEFDLDPYVDRQSSRMGVRERYFQTRLRQRGNFIEPSGIAHALQDWLRQAVDQVLATTPNLHDQDRLYLTLSSNRLTNNFQGWGLRAGEWREGGARLEALFDRLAQALNSNKQFEMDDSFQLSITQAHHAPQGTCRRRQNKPGHPTLQMLTKTSKSVIRIQNKDELCCARALVVAKARVDQHPKEKAIRQGKSLQRTLALQLHHEARVPLGPSGYDALTAFSAAPSLVVYQILLVDAHRSFHITTFGDTQDKQLILLHEKGHYDVITVCRGFSDPVTCAPTVGNPITQRESIGAPNEKTFAGPVAKKPAPISWRLTLEVCKPRNVVGSVIATFLGTRVTKPTPLRTTRANRRPALSPPFAFVDVAVVTASSIKWAPKLFNAINAGTWTVLPATST